MDKRKEPEGQTRGTKQKYSKKYAKKIKKKLQVSMFSIVMILLLIVGSKLAGLYMPIYKLKDNKTYNVIEENKALVNDKENVLSTGNNSIKQNEILTSNDVQNTGITTLSDSNDTIVYIYTANDLVEFRNNVNAGNNYAGKTVYLMNDIDLSTVCSSTLGSWEPIGAKGTIFAGIFDGNYHTISNLYINSGSYIYTGFFTYFTKTVRNLILSNVKINSTYYISGAGTSYTGGIAGYISSGATVINCGITGGTIDGRQTQSVSGDRIVCVGGILGYSYGNVDSCYNMANISSYTNTSNNNNNSRAGGIIGYNSGTVRNCYNRGNITVQGARHYVGGIVGCFNGGNQILQNSYNTGTISINGSSSNTKKAGGIVGVNGDIATAVGTISNSYCTTSSYGISYYYYSGGMKTTTSGRIAAATLQTYNVSLGSAYAYDVYNKNAGYPVLAWQNETQSIELNKKQAYIKTGEKLQLNIVGDSSGRLIENLEITDFTWKSSNEEVAEVNENGLVTGITDGYTTIYGTYKNEGELTTQNSSLTSLKVMCIINVSKGEATPQIETGNGFTVILKSDGTVWTIGNNAKGQLGTGENTGTYSNVLTQVQIDEDTKLENVIKIAVGTDHVLAITKEGRLYAWGDNTNGKLGQNNTKSANYAKIVLGEDGASYLEDIVDISAGACGSIALDKVGNVYVWGNGSYGEIENYSTASKTLPTKTTIRKVIQVSMGVGQVSTLTTEGTVWSWGRNSEGQLGINCVNNTTYPMKTALDVTEISCGGYHTTIKKIDETLYAVGCYGNGRLGTGSTSNITKYAKVNLPNKVTETNKVKYIKSGITNTTILLTDGSIWETGVNLQGELGNGTTVETSTFVQGQMAKETPMENILTIGRNNGNFAGSISTGYGLNTAVILKNGDIYTTGDNTYGQIGDNTKTNTSYYKKMGFAYLDYADKIIEIDENGYQIDINKLKYIQPSSNVYNDSKKYTLGDIRYTSLDTSKIEVNQNGLITSKEKSTGVVKVKIEDITNGYETYITVIVNRIENLETVSYIYNLEDLIRFRDTVNAGNNYAGKTVYLMADIDMSTYCSKAAGSWKPIGATGTNFAGTFDGNYHTISNLYINSNLYANLGFFKDTVSTTVIRNLIMDDVEIYSTYYIGGKGYSYVGGIVGNNDGLIINCAITGGTIDGRQAQSVSGDRIICVGGIAGYSQGKIESCYNKANISGYTNTSSKNINNIRLGGIVGQGSGLIILNCYNVGNISGQAVRHYIGGIVGCFHSNINVMKNCYNNGKITINGSSSDLKKAGGIVGVNGDNATAVGVISNTYCTTSTYGISYYYYNGGMKTTTQGRIEGDTLKTYVGKLGTAYENDEFNINGGYPILWWQAGAIELNKKQAYIKTGDQLQLEVVGAVEVRENIEEENSFYSSILSRTTLGNFATQNLLGSNSPLAENVAITDFNWKSSNEDIAEVKGNGQVTGLKEGYTTIYGTHKEYENVKVMCVVNVAKSGNVATPQIETGNGFTVVLKSDGTVWMTGNEELLATGTGGHPQGAPTKDETTTISTDNTDINENTNPGNVINIGEDNMSIQQVKISETEYLTNVIKISAGTNHVLALTKNGEVYAWGKNENGQLGIGNKTNIITENNPNVPIYATNVTGEGGTGTLKRIVDISAGEYGSSAINEFGWVYVWGNGSYGEMANGTTINSNTPIKTTINNGISVARGTGHIVAQGQNGKLYTWGKNDKGQLGTGNKVNSTTVAKIANGITDITAGGSETIVKNIEGNIYGTGQNTNGELGIGTNANVATLTKITIPDIVTGENNNTDTVTDDGRPEGAPTSKVKYIKAGKTNTTILLNNGTVWSTGINTNGELGNGDNNNSNTFVQGKTIVETAEDDNPDVVGEDLRENFVEQNSLSQKHPLEDILIIGRNNGGLNTAVILENGAIYITGDNTYSQITNETEESTNYYMPIRYAQTKYPEIIEMQVGETRNLTEEEKTYIRKYINTYENDKEEITKLENGEIKDTNIATYEEEEIQAKEKGNTELILEEEKGKQIKIPIRVIDYNTGIEYIEVNGKKAESQIDGTYIVKIKDTETEMVIEAQTINEVSNIKIDEGEYETHNTTKTIITDEKESIHKIQVQSENGAEQTHTLKIVKVSGNTKIKELSVKTTKEIENEETGEIQKEEKTEIIKQLEDGTYYLKIDRIEQIDIKAILEEQTSEVKIQNSKYGKGEKEETIDTIGEKTEIIIQVKAEDGTTENHILILEKKSNDTSLKAITSEEIIKQENNKIYVSEGLEELDLTLETNNKNAKIKLLEEEEYSKNQITRTININQEIEEGQEGIEVNIQIEAEDGTIQNHTITIIKTGDANIKTVKIEGQEIIKQNSTYTGRINIAQTAEIEITSQNEKAKIQIIETEIGENGEEQENIIKEGTGIINTQIQLKENPQKYKIRVTSENGSETRDYELRIEQKSEETGITYVKIDGLTAIETEEGYNSKVTGKEKYQIQIKLTNEKAKVKIQSQEGKTIIENQEGKLEGQLEIEDSSTEEYKIIVTAENGNEKEYNLKITRISNNVKLEYVKINGKEKQPDKNEGETYTIEISKKAETVEIEAKTKNSKAKIKIGNNEEEIQTTTRTIDCKDTEKDEIEIPIKVTAEDGKTIKTYTLKIKRTGTIITGNIKTENVEGKHKATIRVYKTEEVEIEQLVVQEEIEEKIENKTETEQTIKVKEQITKEIIEEKETEEDGSFELILEKGQSYDIEISKKGYLTYTITNVEKENIEKGDIEINIGEISLIAGDVAENGEIEIDDLVDLNDNYGIEITEANKERKGKYDLNEDGKIDILDRNILKKNYGKTAETIRYILLTFSGNYDIIISNNYYGNNNKMYS